ncbi:MAG: helix-turn-helix domain-containing protein [Planctomycetota bacterium]
MLYSDESVSQVAAAMGFADIYAFSRFFKRASGLSPTAFRRKVGA